MAGQLWQDDGALSAVVSEAAGWHGRFPAHADLWSLLKQAGRLERCNSELRALTKGQGRRISELEARNEALEAFAHSVAHDLKGSLSTMISFAEVLQDPGMELSAEERQMCLRRITSSGWKLNGVVDALLLLASTRPGEVVAGPGDMADVVCQARERLDHVVEDQGAQIVVPEEWPVAIGHGPWIEEVWVNYMSNAIKYGGRPPHVELGATREDGFARFWVRDNGQGVALEDPYLLFSPSARRRQVHSAGHGLGLSIVQRIVDRLGGAVGIESKVGQGSTFSFTLPVDGRSVLSER